MCPVAARRGNPAPGPPAIGRDAGRQACDGRRYLAGAGSSAPSATRKADCGNGITSRRRPVACSTACATAGDLPAGADQDPIRDLIVGVAIALRAGGPHGDRDKQGRAGQRRSGEDKTARHWRHQNRSERSPQCPARLRKRGRTPGRMPPSPIVSARLSRTQRRIACTLRQPAAGRRSFWGNEPMLQKRNNRRGAPWSFATRVRQQEPAQQKTRRGVPPGHVAYVVVLNCALTIRDSGNASQDKTPPTTFWMAVRPRDPVARALSARLAAGVA